MVDILIVGSGPAGLTAALYGRRANKSVLVLEKNGFGGQITFSPKIENYPGFNQVSGNELADQLLDQVMAQGAEVDLDEVTAIGREGDLFTVVTENGVHEAKTVIIATGAKHRLLGVPGETGFVGNGISFCAVCDGAFYTGKEVVVVGGGNSALQEAILLSDLCKSVTVVQNLPHFTGEQKLVEQLLKKENVKTILGATVKEFRGGDELESVVIETEAGEQVLATDGVFVAIGLAPENGPFADWMDLDGGGYAASDETCKTKTEGLFVAGDCRQKGVRQITTATADGATAALAACNYLDNK